MKKYFVIALATILGALVFYLLQNSYFKHKPILLDASTAYDVCGTLSIITRDKVDLNARPAEFSLSKGALTQHQTVNVCIEEGGWSGIIVAPRGTKNCEIQGAVNSSSNKYKGPCEYGWVPTEALRMFAG